MSEIIGYKIFMVQFSAAKKTSFAFPIACFVHISLIIAKTKLENSSFIMLADSALNLFILTVKYPPLPIISNFAKCLNDPTLN